NPCITFSRSCVRILAVYGNVSMSFNKNPENRLDWTRKDDIMISGNRSLFIPGPTNLPPALRAAIDVAPEDQRAPDFPDFTLGLFRDLKRIFKLDGGQVFVFPGSGTGGWEAATTNTLSPGDTVLTSVFGQFSLLWADLCRRH